MKKIKLTLDPMLFLKKDIFNYCTKTSCKIIEDLFHDYKLESAVYYKNLDFFKFLLTFHKILKILSLFFDRCARYIANVQVKNCEIGYSPVFSKISGKVSFLVKIY